MSGCNFAIPWFYSNLIISITFWGSDFIASHIVSPNESHPLNKCSLPQRKLPQDQSYQSGATTSHLFDFSTPLSKMDWLLVCIFTRQTHKSLRCKGPKFYWHIPFSTLYFSSVGLYFSDGRVTGGSAEVFLT